MCFLDVAEFVRGNYNILNVTINKINRHNSRLYH
jgi:hypothetical protein